VSTSGLQSTEPLPGEGQPKLVPNGGEGEIWACWNEIGVHGSGTCLELRKVIRCRNCPVYSKAGVRLLDRPLLPDYRRAWTAHFAQERKVSTPVRTSALVFRVNAQWLALPAKAFQEVAERRLIHSLPHRRQGITLGLVTIRGELLVCVSLGHLLGVEQVPSHQTLRATCERLLVASWDHHRFVFAVDEVRGIYRFEGQDLQEPPATLSKSKRSYTQGIVRWQGRSVGLLNADLIFSAINRSLS
jgi:chemotaxis-related protein WspD